MSKTKKIYFSYLLIELVLYIFFLSFDIQNIFIKESNIIKYSALLLTIVLTTCIYSKKTDCFYLVSLIFIAIADFFLLFTFNIYEIETGIFLFCIGHLCLFWSMTKNKNYLLILSIIIISISLLPISENIYRSAFAYGAILITNLIISTYLLSKNRTKQNLFRTIGFILLLLCDLFVGLNFLEFNVAIWMWLFYLPSFVFLNISYTKII